MRGVQSPVMAEPVEGEANLGTIARALWRNKGRIIGPTLTITQSGANAIVSWTPAVGTLQQSTDLVNWVNSPNQANGAARPAGSGNLFFRVLR